MMFLMSEPRREDDPAAKPFDPNEDPFAPPQIACQCYCLHCRRTFMSDAMWFQRVIGDRHLDGFWMCPTANCSGMGFTFDIFPTDPDHPANDGWFDDDDDDDADDEREVDDNGRLVARSQEWDPNETKYKELDDAYGDDDDLEGEEWKLGLAPGERPPAPPWLADDCHDWDEEQRKYDAPDERPRVLDWTDRPQREHREAGDFDEDDIPF